jgi:phage I-like protein
VRFGYWSDLASLSLGDGENTATWIQAMPLGEYDHPVYGKIKIDEDRTQHFAANVKNQVRGQELDIDYDHKEYGGEAAGWVKDAEARSDGLWLLIEWTKKAYQMLKDKAYRYFSPEFNDEWKHPKSGETYKDVLFGGAITNRPFLKDIVPINLSDLFAHGAFPAVAPPPPPPAPTLPAPTTDPSKGGQMDPKILRGILGLAEDASDEQVTIKLQELAAPRPTMDPALTDPASPDELARLVQRLSDVDGNPAIKALTELVTAQRNQLATILTEQKIARVDRQLADLDKGKSFAVPPVVKAQLRDILLRSPDELGQQVFKAYEQTMKLGVIDLTERGWQRRGDELSPSEQMLAEVAKRQQAATAAGQKMSYAEAVSIVSRENPALSTQYREDSYIPEGR